MISHHDESESSFGSLKYKNIDYLKIHYCSCSSLLIFLSVPQDKFYGLDRETSPMIPMFPADRKKNSASDRLSLMLPLTPSMVVFGIPFKEN